MAETPERKIATYGVVRRTCQKHQRKELSRTESGAVHVKRSKREDCHVWSCAPYMAKTPERRNVTYGARHRTWQKKQKRRLPRTESRVVHVKNAGRKNCHVRSRASYMSKTPGGRIVTYRVRHRTWQKKQKRRLPRTESRVVHVKIAGGKNCHVQSRAPYMSKEAKEKILTYGVVRRTWQVDITR